LQQKVHAFEVVQKLMPSWAVVFLLLFLLLFLLSLLVVAPSSN